ANLVSCCRCVHGNVEHTGAATTGPDDAGCTGCDGIASRASDRCAKSFGETIIDRGVVDGETLNIAATHALVGDGYRVWRSSAGRGEAVHVPRYVHDLTLSREGSLT